MAEPRIPFVQIPDLPLIPQDAFGVGTPPTAFSIKPFGTLVAIGVYLGAYLAVRQGKRLGLDEKAVVSFVFWVVGMGFVLGHVLDVVLYYPERLASDPLALVRLWDGLSSFGGFVGAAVGALLWKWRHGTPVLPYVDVVASAFPLGWVFGRAGCAVAHDHPGIRSDAWLAVAYPAGSRFDLGLLEMLLSVPLAVAFLVLRKKPRPWGFYVGAMSIYYAPLRFSLDFLRVERPLILGDHSAVADPRYGNLTPAQWMCLGLLAFGVWMFAKAMSTSGTAAALRVPEKGALSAAARSGSRIGRRRAGP